jgi:3-oxoacyl-[acyl-carrier protein] reductase
MDYQDEFKGKRVVITGAAGIYGVRIASAFAKAGATLCLSDMRVDKLPEVVKQAGADSATTLLHKTELTDATSIRDLAATVAKAWGAPDILVNNAGVYPRTGILVNLDDAEFDRIMSVNVRAPFILTKEMAKLMIAAGRQGSVINIGSGAARQMPTGSVTYCMSKTALERLSKGQALELAAHGIRVNVVEPGFAPGSEVSLLPDDYVERMIARIPMGRMGTEQDAASMVMFLCSNAASFVTGSVVAVDGGNSIGTYQPAPAKS